MTEPTPKSSTRLDLAAGLAEVSGLAFVAGAGYVLHLAAGLALTGAALFCVGFFGLAPKT